MSKRPDSVSGPILKDYSESGTIIPDAERLFQIPNRHGQKFRFRSGRTQIHNTAFSEESHKYTIPLSKINRKTTLKNRGGYQGHRKSGKNTWRSNMRPRKVGTMLGMTSFFAYSLASEATYKYRGSSAVEALIRMHTVRACRTLHPSDQIASLQLSVDP
jgi:hypothetical protein